MAENSTEIGLKKFSYNGEIGKLYILFIKKILLSIVTLGIYSFWGKTKIRKYVTGSINLGGESLEYNGTGKELFIGFLKSLPIFIVIAIWFQFAVMNMENPIGPIMIFIGYFVIYFLIKAASYGTKRYIYSRTTFRGIRGNLKGSAVKFAIKSIGYDFLRLITLNLIGHKLDIALHKYVADNSYYGTEQVAFEGDSKEMFNTHIKTWLLFIPTFGFSRVWYQAAFANYTMNGTKLDNVGFESYYKGSDLFVLFITNLLIIAFTFGLGFPIAMHRNYKYAAENIAVTGDIDTLSTKQAEKNAGAFAEGLEDGLDASGDLGIGLV